MTTFIIRRLILAVVTLFLITIIVFFAMRLLPGDPILLKLKVRGGQYTEEQLQQARHNAGLDRPLIQQYFSWLNQLAHGDLGTSILKQVSVWEEIKLRIPVTTYLAAWAFIIAGILGPLLGIIAAVKRGKWQDTVVTTLSNLAITVPSFWLGIVLMYIFAVKLHWLPAIGYTSPMVDFVKSTKQIIMPVICLAVFPIAANARQTRTAMLEVMRQDYIRTAWAKGLRDRVIIIRHALKNSLIPVVTLMGLEVSTILGGAVVIENVFAIPGMGRLVVGAAFNDDYPYVQAIVLIVAATVMLMNLIVDLAYGWLDPRIRYS